MTVAVAIKGTITVAVRETKLNSLITRVVFGEILLSGLGALMGTLSMKTILNGVGQLAATCS